MKQKYWIFFLFTLNSFICIHATSHLSQSLLLLKNKLSDLAKNLQIKPEVLSEEKISTIQALARGKIARDEYKKITDATKTIQALAKGHLKRGEFDKLKNATIKIQALARGTLDRDKYEKSKEAATTIQALLRGKLEKDKQEEMKKNIITIQSLLRGKIARDQLAIAKKEILEKSARAFISIAKILQKVEAASKDDFISMIQTIETLHTDMLKNKQLATIIKEMDKTATKSSTHAGQTFHNRIKLLEEDIKNFDEKNDTQHFEIIIDSCLLFIDFGRLLIKEKEYFIENTQEFIQKILEEKNDLSFQALTNKLNEKKGDLENQIYLIKETIKSLPKIKDSEHYKGLVKKITQASKIKQITANKNSLEKNRNTQKKVIGIDESIDILKESLDQLIDKLDTLIAKMTDEINSLKPQTAWHDLGLSLEQKVKEEEQSVIKHVIDNLTFESIDLTEPLSLPDNFSLSKEVLNKKTGKLEEWPKTPTEVINELKSMNSKLAYLLYEIEMPEFGQALKEKIADMFWDTKSQCVIKQEIELPSYSATDLALASTKKIISCDATNQDRKGIYILSTNNKKTNEKLLTENDTHEYNKITISPNGRYLIAQHQLFLDIFDLQTATKLWRLKTNARTTPCISPDDKYIFIPASNKIFVFDFQGKQINSIDILTKIGKSTITYSSQKYKNEIIQLLFTPDGKKIIVTDREGTIYIFNVVIENSTINLKLHKTLLWQPNLTLSEDRIDIYKNIKAGPRLIHFLLAISNDGKKLVSRLDEAKGYEKPDTRIRVWDIESGKETNSFDLENISVLTMTPDRKRIILGTYDGNIVVWDLLENKLIQKFTGHAKKRISLLAIENNTLISAAKEITKIKYTDVWEYTGKIKIWTLPHYLEKLQLDENLFLLKKLYLEKKKQNIIISDSWNKIKASVDEKINKK